MADEKDKNMSLEAFRQDWEDYRHNERKRLYFTQLYMLIMVGVLAFVSEAQLGVSVKLTIYGYLLVISLIGLLMTLRLGVVISASLKRIEDANFKFPEDRHWTAKIRERRLFLFFYVVSFLLVFGLFINVLVD